MEGRLLLPKSSITRFSIEHATWQIPQNSTPSKINFTMPGTDGSLHYVALQDGFTIKLVKPNDSGVLDHGHKILVIKNDQVEFKDEQDAWKSGPIKVDGHHPKYHNVYVGWHPSSGIGGVVLDAGKWKFCTNGGTIIDSGFKMLSYKN